MATLGIDIGGTNLSLGLVGNGKIVQIIHVSSFPGVFRRVQRLKCVAGPSERVETGHEIAGKT